MSKLVDEIREALKPYPAQGFVGTCVPMPTLEQVGLLIAEVESLSEDREWQIKQNVRMFAVIEEAVKYLDTNNLTSIAYGSILHQQLRDALITDPV